MITTVVSVAVMTTSMVHALHPSPSSPFSPVLSVLKAAPNLSPDSIYTNNFDAGMPSRYILFIEMGIRYDQHGQDITVAAMRAYRDAIFSNSIPTFRRGLIPSVNSDQMKLKNKLRVPKLTQESLDVERVKTVFP